MTVARTPKGKWRAEVRHKDVHYHLGIFGSEAAAAAACEAEYAAIRAGTSEILKFPGTLTMRTFSERIAVKEGTIKRWIHEGLPVIRGAAFLRIDPAAAERWIAAHYPDTVAFHRRSVVYFAQRQGDGAIKIGFSSDIARRLKELRRDTKQPCTVLAVVPGDKERELALHARFAYAALGEEWFAPCVDLLGLIDSIGKAAA